VVYVTPVSGYAIRPAKPVSITTVASGGSTHGPPVCIHGSPTRHINPTRQHVSDPDDPPAFHMTVEMGFIIPIPLIASRQGFLVTSFLFNVLICPVSTPDIRARSAVSLFTDCVCRSSSGFSYFQLLKCLLMEADVSCRMYCNSANPGLSEFDRYISVQ